MAKAEGKDLVKLIEKLRQKTDFQVVYDSKTGNVERFVSKLRPAVAWQIDKVSPGLIINQPYHLITFTTNFGEIPATTAAFLEMNHSLLKSVTSSGNMNWGPLYAVAADKISQIYGRPVLMKFELSGGRAEVKQMIYRLAVEDYLSV